MSGSFLSMPVRRPVLTTVVYVIIIVIGLFSLWRLPIDLMPEITYPRITVITNYGNAGPQEVEELISRPIESSLAGVQGIEEITSTSSEGRSVVRASFAWGTNLDEAVNDIRDRIDRVLGRLPEDIDRPMIRKFDMSAFPIMFVGVSSELDPADVRQFIEDQVQYRLERVDGVASVDIRGGARREIQVKLRASALEALKISPDMVVSTLKQENRNIPAGSVDQGNKEIIVRTFAEYSTIEDVRDAVIAVRDGVPVTVGEVAEIVDGLQEITSMVRINREPGLTLAISKQSGVNTVAVASGVKKEIARINQDFPQVKVVPLTDTSKFIAQAIASMGNALVLGGIIAIIILLIFLRNISSTFIIATAIPISIIATFALIYFGGLTLNMMTFGGLALGIGMLVDNAIVVLDNIFHHREKGGKPFESAVTGSSEVASAVIASTLTTLVVFFPVIFIRGMSGIMFKQLAFVVSFSLACSLFAALTLIPMLSSRFLKIPHREKGSKGIFAILFDKSEQVYCFLEAQYSVIIAWALHHRKTVLLISFLLFVGSILMIPMVGAELMPSADEGEVRVNVEMEVGTRLELLDSAVAKIESIVSREVPETEFMLTNIGGSGWGSSGGHTANIRVSLIGKAKRSRSSAEIANVLRRKITNIPGATIRVREGQGLFILRMGQGDAQTIGIELRGHDLETGQQLATEISQLVTDVEGVTDTRVSREAGMPEFVLHIDRKKAADLGLTASQIGTAVQTAMGGTQATSLRREGKEYTILVRLAESERQSIDQLSNLVIVNRNGISVPIQTVAKINEASGPVQIERRDRERIITVDVSYAGKDLGSVVEQIRQKLTQITIPSSFAVVIRGDYEEQQKAQRELLVGLAMAILLIYLVMAGQFESFKDPLIVLFSIPMALVGVVGMLYLTATPFSMQAYIGCIVLAGVVVNNAIVLIDYMNKLRREQGMELHEAVKTAGVRRLRPILMTAFTTALGLLPLALALGEGGEAQAPMARVVIGGLLTASFITLLLIPVIYSLVEERHQRKKAQKHDTGNRYTALSSSVLLIAVLGIFGSSYAAKDDTLKLSLEDVLNRAVQHNPLVRIERIDMDIAKTIVKENRYRFEPKVSAALEQNRSLVDGPSSPDYQGSAGVSGTVPTGTDLQVRGFAGPVSRSMQTMPGATHQRGFELTVTQALLAGGGLGVNLAPLRKASLDLDIQQEELAGYAQRLLAETERAYWDLFLAEREADIHQRSLELAQRLLYESQERLNVGRIAPLDLVTVKAEKASREKNLINARIALVQKTYKLAYLVNDSIAVWEQSVSLTDKPFRPSEPDSLSLHLEAARSYRPDFRQAQYLAGKNELDIVQTRNGLLPRLDLFVTLSGTAYAESFTDALGGDLDSRNALSAGLALSLPLTNGAARQRYHRATLSQKQTQLSIENLKNLIELDVRVAWTEVQRTLQQITAAQVSRTLQEEKLSAEQARLAAGKSTEYLVLQAQRDLIAAQLDEARAEVAYVNAVADLYLKDGTLLERRGVKSKPE